MAIDMTDWQTNLPAGTRLSDIDRRDRDDDEFWSQWWDDQHRFAEENERDERFRERQEQLERRENYERSTGFAED